MTKKYLAITAFILLILALGYGVSRRTKPTPQTKPPTPPEQNQQSSPSGKTPEPPIAVPEGWKVYENKELGFKVGYPSDWYEQELARGGKVTAKQFTTIKNFESIPGILGKLGDKNIIFTIFVVSDFPYKTLEEARENNSGHVSWLKGDDQADYVKKVTFKGYPAIERMGRETSPTEPYHTLTLDFIKGDRLYVFKLVADTKDVIQFHELTFRQIIDTFVFNN